MKAVLVIDMPDNCEGCPCTDYMFCYATHKELEISWEANRPTWCPLKPMPQYEDVGEMKRLAEKVGSKKECAVAYAYGYNDCINDILGYQDESNISD